MTEIKEFVGGKVWNEYRLTGSDKNSFVDITTPAGKFTLLPGCWILKVEEPKQESHYMIMDDRNIQVLFEVEEVKSEAWLN